MPLTVKAKKRVTLADVAAKAGVSISTVSFVLNARTDMRVSAQTRAEVLNAAEELGYTHRNAGRPQQKLVVGLMIDNITVGDHAPYSVEAIEEVARDNDVLVEIVVTGDNRDYQSSFLRKWKSEGVAGVLYLSNQTRVAEPPQAFSEHNGILVNTASPNDRYISIVPDEITGAANAVYELFDQGIKRPAFVGSNERNCKQRFNGYVHALEQRNVELDEDIIVSEDRNLNAVRRAVKDLMKLPNPPDGIFCENDRTAIGAYKALRELGIAVGRDMPLIGFDNLELGLYLHPTLTTVNMPDAAMGRLAIERLLGITNSQHRITEVDCPLVLRQSHLGA